MSKRLLLNFWHILLVFGGCGSAVLAAAFPQLGIGFLGVALAFGLTVVTMAYAVGHISGGHFNPAVTVGLFAGGRFAAIPYVIAQVIGGIRRSGGAVFDRQRQSGFDATAGGLPQRLRRTLARRTSASRNRD